MSHYYRGARSIFLTTAFDRRVKKVITSAPQRVIVRCARDWRAVCQAEVEGILSNPVHDLKFSPQIVATSQGIEIDHLDFRALLQVAMQLTTARRLMWVIAEGKITSVAQLRKIIDATPWDLYAGAEANFTIKARSTASRLFHERRLRDTISAALTAKGLSIVATPAQSELALPKAYILEARLKDDRLTLSLSISTRPLYQRGYRAEMRGEAPLREDLAAACIRHLQSLTPEAATPDIVFVPFAGSGTFGFEATMHWGCIPPAIFWDDGDLAAFPATPRASKQHIKRTLLAQALKPPPVLFLEINPEQARVLQRNAQIYAQQIRNSDIVVKTGDFTTFDWTTLKSRHVACLMNPPYGLRLSTRKAAKQLLRATATCLNLASEAGLRSFRGIILIADASNLTQVFLNDLNASWQTAAHTFSHGGIKVQCVSLMLTTET